MEKFSIIIPTMWKSPLIFKMLQKYQDCPAVAEVIIIDNNYDLKLHKETYFHCSLFKKVSVCHCTENIYVNKAWNHGVELSPYTIILANDDIYIDLFDELMGGIIFSDYDLIGATINNLSDLPFSVNFYDKHRGFPRKSFGCFMVCRKYIPIPEDMKILCGDNWLFDHAGTVGIIGSGYIETPISVTIRSNPAFNEIGKKDKEIYRKLIQTTIA